MDSHLNKIVEIPKRTIICSPQNFNWLKSIYPKRPIVAESYIANHLFYYIGKPLKKFSNSTVRLVFLDERGVYTHDLNNYPFITRVK